MFPSKHGPALPPTFASVRDTCPPKPPIGRFMFHHRRMKAAYAAFAEEEIVRLRKEKPGLKLNQYKDMAFKLWQKSPANPMNQAGRTAETR
jgi:Coiled-coil domain-containing protein 124 /Oxs1